MKQYFLCKISTPELTFRTVLSAHQLDNQESTLKGFSLPEESNITILERVGAARFLKTSLLRLVP